MQILDLVHAWYIIPASFISEDLTYLSALTLVQSGKIDPFSFVFFFSVGAILGDWLLYLIGYLIGKKSDWKIVRKIKSYFTKNIKGQSQSFQKIDKFLVFTRVLPGSRIPTYVSCGISGYPLLKFTRILFLSALVYCLVGLGVLSVVHNMVLVELSFLSKILISLFSFFVTSGLFSFFYEAQKLKETYGRVFPFLWIKIARLRRIEFWNGYMMYLPFVPFFLRIFFQHFRFTPIYANLGIYMGGIVGERKSDIDEIIGKYAIKHRLNTIRIERSEFINFDKTFNNMSNGNFKYSNLNFPLVVKPDVGLRGREVCLVNNLENLCKELDRANGSVVLQEYCDFPKEWGIYFYKYPGESKGRILSINDKLFPMVVGNGVSTVLDLILAIPEYRIRFDLIVAGLEVELGFVVPKGQQIRLVFRGNHSKGCIFKNVELEEDVLLSVNFLVELLSKMDGFNFGRLDVRFLNLEELSKGNFKIIEINGAGAEPTNIYDPNLSPFRVYQYLYQQWKHSFKIGSLNKKRSTQDLGLLDLFRQIWMAKPD